MANLFIQDTTLTAIADAIRTKSGGGATEPIVEIRKSPNVNSPEDYTPGAAANGSASGGGDYFAIKIEGASQIEVKFWYEFNNPTASYCYMKSGYYETRTWKFSEAEYSRSGVSGSVLYEVFVFDNTDAVSMIINNAGTSTTSFGYYFEVRGYDASGNPVGEGSGTPLTYTPLEMPAAILSISGEGGGGITPTGELEILENGDFDVTTYASAHVAVPTGIFPEGTLEIKTNGEHKVTTYDNVFVSVPTGGADVDEVVLSGDVNYGLSSALAAAFMELYPDKIRTENLTTTQYLCRNSKAKRIPFSLNWADNSTAYNTNYMFANAYELEELPAMNNYTPKNSSYLCQNARMLREIPEGFTSNWNFSQMNVKSNTTNAGYVFSGCYSLRRVDSNFTKHWYNGGTSSYACACNSLFYECYNLDEVVGLGVMPDLTITTNLLNAVVYGVYCIRRFTFATQDNGDPISVNWSNQTLNFADNFGYRYANDEGAWMFYNSGRTTNDRIYDATSYAKNKNNPNAYVYGNVLDNCVGYCFYNKVAAEETIRSLPDASSSGGVNTIKLKGESGKYTDGGAIKDMSEEVIAMATAKGWTVTLV